MLKNYSIENCESIANCYRQEPWNDARQSKTSLQWTQTETKNSVSI